MADEPELRLFTVNFGDKEITFHSPTEGQLLLLGRAVHKAEKGGGRNVLAAVSLILDVIDRLVVDADDRNWLEEGLLDGVLVADDFIGVLNEINVGEEEAARPAKKTVASAARTRGPRGRS